MTKADLVEVMAKATGGSKTAAERAMNAFVRDVIDSLRRGRHVTISGFGTFVVTKRAARNGRNPRTGKAITIPPAKVPRFRPSRALKSALR
jgi:DNA-binding protein HU-beta